MYAAVLNACGLHRYLLKLGIVHNNQVQQDKARHVLDTRFDKSYVARRFQ